MLNSLKGRKIHTRNIQIATYETDTENLIVEGILKDNLLISHYHTSGEKHPPNTVHHMVVRMLIYTLVNSVTPFFYSLEHVTIDTGPV